MSTKTKNVVTPAQSFTTLKDFGIRFASGIDDITALRKEAASNIAGFPDNISEEDKEEIVAGFQVRYANNHPAKHYKLEGIDTLIELQSGKGDVVIDVHFAMGLSTFEFSSLKKERPNYQGIINEVRESFRKYRSQCWNSLTKKERSKTRTVNYGFYEYMKKLGNTLEKRNATANKKADPSAVGKDQFRKAWQAFLVAITK